MSSSLRGKSIKSHVQEIFDSWPHHKCPRCGLEQLLIGFQKTLIKELESHWTGEVSSTRRHAWNEALAAAFGAKGFAMSATYDAKCEELARYFLADEEHEPEEVASLSQEIQDSIERWFEPRQSKPRDVTP